MDNEFQQIKQKYDEFYNFLLKRGQLPIKDTGVGFWGISVGDEIFELFKRIHLEKFKHFIDLGSGDGKVVLIASLFTDATGIEYDKWLHESAVDIQKKLSHIPRVSKATFTRKNFTDHSITDYDIVFVNPDKPLHKGLENKLMLELN